MTLLLSYTENYINVSHFKKDLLLLLFFYLFKWQNLGKSKSNKMYFNTVGNKNIKYSINYI